MSTATLDIAIAATPEKRISTLLDVADTSGVYSGWAVRPGEDPSAPALYETYWHAFFGHTDAAMCSVNSKTFDNRPEFVDGFFMTAYGAMVCNAVGGGVDLARTREAFDLGESTAVEKGMVAVGFASPTDVYASAVKAVVAIGLLEEAMSGYAGTPTIHVPLSVGEVLAAAQSIVETDGVFRTKTGAKVAVGAGYGPGPDDVPFSATTRTIWATGEVSIQRSEVVERKVHSQYNNEETALAERGYIVSYDGGPFSVDVELIS